MVPSWELAGQGTGGAAGRRGEQERTTDRERHNNTHNTHRGTTHTHA